MGDIRLDMGPGEMNRICANSVKPGSKVGVGLGSGVVGRGVSVGVGVSVGRGARALAVANADCPVNATTVEIWFAGRGVETATVDCEQAGNNARRNVTIRIFRFMADWNQNPAGSSLGLCLHGVQSLMTLDSV